MEPNQIKGADFLDILFDGRNKEYGAYELRKTYNRRVVKSMIVMGSVVTLVCLGGVVMGLGKGVRVRPFEDGGMVVLQKVPDPPQMQKPPQPKVVVQVAQIRMTTVQIVPDNQARETEKPPENAEADHVQIGTESRAGNLDGDVQGPPSLDGMAKGVAEGPKKSDEDAAFIPIEKEAEFPGGVEAWRRFLNKTLRYPEEAMNIEVQGTVMVQFVVDVDGSVSNVEVISGPEQGGLRAEAVRVIRKSGKWVPALQNGRSVKAFRRQPVVFRQLKDDN